MQSSGIGGAGLNAIMQSQELVKGSSGPAGVADKGTSFEQVRQQVSERVDNFFDPKLQKDMQNLHTDLVKGKTIPARELLVYQMRLGSFNQRVELVSKLAESAMGTVKKFQQQQ
jgi:hypothetical protein